MRATGPTTRRSKKEEAKVTATKAADVVTAPKAAELKAAKTTVVAAPTATKPVIRAKLPIEITSI